MSRSRSLPFPMMKTVFPRTVSLSAVFFITSSLVSSSPGTYTLLISKRTLPRHKNLNTPPMKAHAPTAAKKNVMISKNNFIKAPSVT